jgi:two-component sensor histidine kinase
MQEIHHRVKNSLQLVHTILAMQVRTLTSSEAREQVTEAAARVLAIGAVHHRLYEGGSTAAADAGRYLRGLLTDMKAMLPDVGGERTLDIDIDSLSLNADDLTPLGLITVELVTNALKYGRGSVRVVVERVVDGLEVAVSDEGSGFPAGFDPGACRGLGMRLISALAKVSNGNAIVIDRSVPFGRIVVKISLGKNHSSKGSESI